MACVPLQANSPGGGSYRGGLPVLQGRKREFTDLIAWRRERIDRRGLAQASDKEAFAIVNLRKNVQKTFRG